MLQTTRDIRKVALWLGHATLQSTETWASWPRKTISATHGGLADILARIAGHAAGRLSELLP